MDITWNCTTREINDQWISEMTERTVKLSTWRISVYLNATPPHKTDKPAEQNCSSELQNMSDVDCSLDAAEME